MRKNKVDIITLGCSKNLVDSEQLMRQFKANGYQVEHDPHKINGEIVVVNTCGFIGDAQEESIEMILELGQAKKQGKIGKLFVMGCLSERFMNDLMQELPEVDHFYGKFNWKELISDLGKVYHEELAHDRVLTTPKHYAYLKIADGCFNHCTYCLIPSIRGKYRSYSLEALVAEAKSLGETQELVLVAQDTTRYGEDKGKNQFVELLRKLSELDNICHIRLLYCYPEVVTDELIAEVRDNPKIIKYLDIPLQHSEDRILKLMGRRGTRADYLALIAKLRREIPQIALRTTFIAGFPTETEEEHEALKSFLKEARFENCGFFAYSREEGTPAYKLKGQIPARVKQRRVKALYGVQEALSYERLQTFVGHTVKVLCDEIDYEKSCFAGHAAFQAYDVDGKVFFHAPRAEMGRYYDVLVERADEADLYGHADTVSDEISAEREV